MNALLSRVYVGESLTQDDAQALFSSIAAGGIDDLQLAATLVAMRVRGEAPAELAGAARALLAVATPFVPPPYDCADACGTGGDGSGTINLSTAAALVASAAGLSMVKHGNRSVSSRCGSSDVLEALGANPVLDAAPARRVLDRCGFTYLHAPHYHPAIARVMPVRHALGIRTIFNALGPLLNPARPAIQLVGVYDPRLCEPVAETLRLLGRRAALVVHGHGTDEVALHGPTIAVRLCADRLERLTLEPQDFGLASQPLAALVGGDPAHNAAALRAVLCGEGEAAHAAAVCANAGALLWIAGRAKDPAAGAALARDQLHPAAAARVLVQFIRESNRAD